MIFDKFTSLKNKATEYYNSIIDLNKIHNYMEYLIKLKTNGFNINLKDNLLILGYDSDEHIVVVDTLKPYFYDLMIPASNKTNGIKKPINDRHRYYTIRNQDDIHYGDVFYQIHGSNNTLCDFYKVVSISGTSCKTVKVKKMENKILSFDENTSFMLVEPGEVIVNSRKLELRKYYDFFKIIKPSTYQKHEIIDELNFDMLLKKYDNAPKLINYKKRIKKKNA